MPERQAQGAIVAAANILFGRKDLGEWKVYKKIKLQMLILFKNQII